MDAKIAILENEMTNLKTTLATMLLMVEEIGVNAGERFGSKAKHNDEMTSEHDEGAKD